MSDKSQQWKNKFDALKIIEAQGELFPEQQPDLPIDPDTRLGDFQEQGGYLDEKPMRDTNPRRKGGYVPPRTRRTLAKKGLQKRIEDWRRDQGLEGTNVMPPFFKTEKSFEINPNLIPDSESQRRLKDKLRARAGSGQEGSETAKDFLKKKGGDITDLPQFLKIKDMQEALEREGIGNVFDQEMDKYREEKSGLTIKERVERLSKNAKLRNTIYSAMKSQGLKIGSKLLKGYLAYSLTR